MILKALRDIKNRNNEEIKRGELCLLEETVSTYQNGEQEIKAVSLESGVSIVGRERWFEKLDSETTR